MGLKSALNRKRQQRGVPAGGQFAVERKDEASANLSDPSSTGDTGSGFGGHRPAMDPSMMSLDQLRDEVSRDLGDALYEMEGPDLDRHRVADSFFPEGEFDDAVHALRTLQARLDGGFPPERENKVTTALATFRRRLSDRKERRPDQARLPVSDLRDITRTRVTEAHNAIGGPTMNELRKIELTFPQEDYERALEAVAQVRRRVESSPPPVEMGRMALSSWQAAKVVNPAFSSWKLYSPMAS